MEKMNFDDYVSDYNKILQNQLQFFDNDNQYFAEYKVKKTQSLLKNTPGHILDFGCGIGRSMPFFQQYFPASNLYGCDNSEKSLIEAKKNNPYADFFNTHELTSSSTRFDLIFLSGVMHHIEPKDRQAALKMIKSLLKPDGCVIIFEHNPFNPVTNYLVRTCPFDKGVELLKAKETKKLMTEAGFTQTECHYTLFFPTIVKWLRPLEKYLRYIPLGGQYLILGA